MKLNGRAIAVRCAVNGAAGTVIEVEGWTSRCRKTNWAGLGVPIALAFFLHGATHGQTIAADPSPAGPTKAALPDEAGDGLVGANPKLVTLDAEVETLLVSRVHGSREYDRAPIDKCYKLVGTIRTH